MSSMGAGAALRVQCAAQAPSVRRVRQARVVARAQLGAGQPARQRAQEEEQQRQRVAGGLLGLAAAASLLLAPGPALAGGEPFLKSTAQAAPGASAAAAHSSPAALRKHFNSGPAGGRGILEVEEEQLFRLRQEIEGEVREELLKTKAALEQEARRERRDDQLCATPFGIDVVGITEFVALTGALVGGVSARRRKQELERLNEQLRTINTQLRQQARAGTLFAPGLTYAPISPGGVPEAEAESLPDAALENGAAAAAAMTAPPAAAPAAPAAAAEPRAGAAPWQTAAPGTGISVVSVDEEDGNMDAKQCRAALKDGKRFLKEQNGGAAMVRFEKALMLAKSLGDRLKEKRATRGLAASARMQGQLRQAIKHLERVLELSREMRDFVGDADAYGTIADVYTDLGDFDRAAEYYDKYISRMDDSVV